jgi:hypothetical protein
MMADKLPLAPLTLDHRDRRTQRLMKSPRGGPPMTLGNAAGGSRPAHRAVQGVRHQIESSPAEIAKKNRSSTKSNS